MVAPSLTRMLRCTYRTDLHQIPSPIILNAQQNTLILFSAYPKMQQSFPSSSTTPTPSLMNRSRRSRPRSQRSTSTTTRRTHSRKHSYTCTLCWKRFSHPCYILGPGSRIVCRDCWKWTHDISVCWRCGEIVFRLTDAVSFGWC
jgi:hypothetical protein